MFRIGTRVRNSLAGYHRVCDDLAMASNSRPISDMGAFRQRLQKSKDVVILSGAGVSAESGVPTFRGDGGFWRKYQATNLATPGAFSRDPSLVWEFYHYRRELVLTKEPNPAHIAIAEFQKRYLSEGKQATIITQNIDGLHQRAGAQNVIEIHGSLFKTRCTKCGNVEVNNDSPICPALKDKGAPDPDANSADIKVEDLPHCGNCKGLLRPHVVWFGESLFEDVLDEVAGHLNSCDLCLVVGTSSIVYPAAMFAPQVAARGVPVAEFNLETTPATDNFQFHFEGPCGKSIPVALAP
ncbi:NAD-dependent protein deacylase sirtuin-5, mitochondrial-like [Ischnura elegans]|uniref:NAD-dependent protein deacylase sirtuin-5, mitochondrial-like n=1 Tax=Ischnura elegans TaxID=197161 RepID=UPI001ED8A6D0|nr:NAD-dependent protein deacylase sirtuin-5, mitochondrial-like [Ischnura elegans]XP_046386334.1 NAD-dependent protein deacylase sirtuin-5, mitochondrial-like [Ischnura elegans]XP_046386335.1 NAD-dependent protein deacylase sirtuin-5, mitochondrial-like [Ischnura elegans]